MDQSILEQIKKNETLFLANAEDLEEEIEQDDVDTYLAIQGATDTELTAFEHQFQIQLPEDFKAVYRYKNGTGSMPLIWPQEDFYRGYQLLSLREMAEIKSHFQNENREMRAFPELFDETQIQQLNARIRPYLSCERWFPFATYANSLYLMLDYNPAPDGTVGQIICYVHDPDFIEYIAPNITEALKLTESVIENLV